MDEQTSGSGGPPPGWYPDPEVAGNRRWWDGTAWSDLSEPMTPDPSPGVVGSSATSPGPAFSQPVTPAASLAGRVDTWLWQSIVATLLCCQPLGVVGIAFAAQAQTATDLGDLTLARKKAATAKNFTLWSAGIALLIYLGFLLVAVAGVVFGV